MKLSRFFWTKENKDIIVTRSFAPNAKIKLKNWQACLLDWVLIILLIPVMYLWYVMYEGWWGVVYGCGLFLVGWVLGRLS